MSEAYEILTGPFDELKEEIIGVFEERAGLSKRMGWIPRIDDVSLSFHTGIEPFTYDINSMHRIGGVVDGIEFGINLARDRFSRDPGEKPHFHHNAVTRIEIPGRVLFLFRGYPEYYVSTQEPPPKISEFIDTVIFHSESALCVEYKPDRRKMPYRYEVDSVLTDLILYRGNKNNFDFPGSFPQELPFSEVYKEFERFFRKIIELLKTAPVMTRGMTKEGKCE